MCQGEWRVDVEGCWRDIAGGRIQEEVEKTKKEMFQEKRIHGKFTRYVSEVVDEKLWQCSRGLFLLPTSRLCKGGFFRPWLRRRMLVQSVECVARRWSRLSIWPVVVLVWPRGSIRGDMSGWVWWCTGSFVRSMVQSVLMCGTVYKEVPDGLRVSEDVEIW